MSSEQSGVKRRSRAAVEALVSECEASGLSRKAFWAERGVAVAALDKDRIPGRDAAEALVSECEASGLSRKAFGAERGLAVATLDKYRIRVRQTAAAPRLLAVDVRPAEIG